MSTQSPKLAVIGGGSSYTPEFIDGLIRNYREFPVRDVYLADIPEGEAKLNIVAALAKRMVAAAGLPIQIHATLDRREAIDGAQFVATQLRVGQLAARVLDEQIPLAHGCIGQETTGAGGFANALRTIPVLLDIARDIEALAPEAVLLNFTNPAGVVTQALLQNSQVTTIGLCNLPIGMKMHIAQLYDVPAEAVDTETVGINHLNWVTKVSVFGKDVTAETLAKIGAEEGASVANIPDLQWDPDLLHSLGAIPCSYLRYYYMPDEMLRNQQSALATEGTRGQVVQGIEAGLFELYQDRNLDRKPPQLALRGGAYYSEAAVNLMVSIFQNRRDIQTVNVRNNGVVPCLTNDAVVEVNCVIDAQGAHPIQLTRHIPPALRGLLQVVKAYEDLTVQAAVTGDRDAALQALTIHPLVPSARIAKQLLKDILAKGAPWLPQFQ